MARAVAVGRTALLQLTVTRWKGLPVVPVVSASHCGIGKYQGTCGNRAMSGTTDGRDEENCLGEEIADLNAEIEGFVGDLGDPDFDTTPPSGSRQDGGRIQDVSNTFRGIGETASHQQQIQAESRNQPQRRLTLADHPSFPGSIGKSTDDGFKADWSTTLTAEGPQRRVRGAKSVLVLNGAACFIAGKLANTGEPQGDVKKSMQVAAEELGLSLTVCTSNREDELLDQLSERKYDAIVYNPSGFGYGRAGIVPTNPVHPMNEKQLAANTATNLSERDKTPFELQQGDSGRVIEYGLARASCPVVVISPRWKLAGARACELGRSNHGTISGFSGVVSYRLAMTAVASMLDEIR